MRSTTDRGEGSRRPRKAQARGILAKSSVGGRIIEDRLFQDFLAGLRIEQPD
jgi:hypothetical protein